MLLIMLMGTSCDGFLEQPEKSGLTPEVVFSDFNTAEDVLAAAYAVLPCGIPHLDNDKGPLGFRVHIYTASVSNCSDESDTYSIHSESGVVDLNYQKGGLTPETPIHYREDKWFYYFQAIRNCYLYLENIDKVKKNATPELIARRKAEAKVLLAIQHFEVFKRYGGLPWVPGLVKPGDPANIQPRLSVEESVERIVKWCDEAIAEPNLPMTSSDEDFGRANKANALMLKARVLLWAASPLFNNIVFPYYGQQHLVRYMDISSSAVQKRWEAARDAAKDAITQLNAAGYCLVGEEGGVVDPNDPGNQSGENYRIACDLLHFPSDGNTELVWGVRGEHSGVSAGVSNFVPYQNWGSKEFGSPIFLALQNLVDQYELKNGEMQPSNQLSQADPYVGLDARFDQSILHHGSVLKEGIPVQRVMNYLPGGSNVPNNGSNYTGYCQRKFLNDYYQACESITLYNVVWPLMRMADLYLMMAEASNEAGDISTSLEWLNKVRQRSGQPKLQDTHRWQNSSQDKEYLRKCIMNERNIELAFEDNRYFDLRRWLMGDEEPSYVGPGKGSIGGRMYCVRLSGTASSPIISKTLFEERTFSDKFYFAPIPQADINQSGGILLQNPGW